MAFQINLFQSFIPTKLLKYLQFPLAAALLYPVATSLKLTSCPIILFFPHYQFNNSKAKKIYTFRIIECIISTYDNFYYFELLYYYLTCHAIQIARRRGVTGFIYRQFSMFHFSKKKLSRLTAGFVNIQKKKINQIDYKSRKQRTEKPQFFES